MPDLAAELIGQVVTPSEVRDEISNPAAPAAIRDWVSKPPTRLSMGRVPDRPPPRGEPDLDRLHAGEPPSCSQSARAPNLPLIDEKAPRSVTEKRGLRVTGLLGLVSGRPVPCSSGCWAGEEGHSARRRAERSRPSKPASTTPVEVHSPAARDSRVAHARAVAIAVAEQRRLRPCRPEELRLARRRGVRRPVSGASTKWHAATAGWPASGRPARGACR